MAGEHKRSMGDRGWLLWRRCHLSLLVICADAVQ